MFKKRVGIIGGGQVAETAHLPFYQSRSELEVVAVFSRNEERVKAFAERHGIPHFYTDVSEMLKQEQLDLVSVCTPNSSHYKYVMEALKFKCDVLCEKPPGIEAVEAKEMYELAEKNNCVLAYNFQHRFSDDATIVKKNVETGVLGEVYAAKAIALRRSGVPGWGNFTSKELQGGGPLIDIGIHMLDSALYIMGFPKVEKVTAKMFQKIGNRKSEGTFGTWNPEKYEVEDSLFGFIELEGGALLQVETSFALHIKEKSELNAVFYGDKAGASLYPAQVYTDHQGEFVSIAENENRDSHLSEKSMQAFVDRCFGKDVMIADGRQGYIVQRVIEALYQSAETGASVHL